MAAAFVVVVHLGFVAFAILGGYAVWRWRTVLPLHLTAVAISVSLALSGLDCPLTDLEKWLRGRAGDAVYRGGFIAHYLVPGDTTAALRIATVAVAAGAYVPLILRSRWPARRA
jgi:hypothetical protein